ncbi:MAG: hypothetical protein LUD47_01350 [Clostridia bacterium]|nr:hypothetical protein [Clostridia bacterium]
MIDWKLYKDLQDKIESSLSSCGKAEKTYLEAMRRDLTDDSFCRIPISDRFGDDFRDFQYKYECVLNTVLSLVKDELADAEGSKRYQAIYEELAGWKDTAKQLFGV